jgi:hypothetical protein
MVYDRGFEVPMSLETVVSLLNDLYKKHGTPIYECDDEAKEAQFQQCLREQEAEMRRELVEDIGDPDTHQNWRGRPC